MREFIKILEAADMGGKKRRASASEFIQMARTQFGTKASKLTLPDLIAVGELNGVQIPSEIRHDRNLKVDAHHYNLSGGPGGENVDAKVAADTGVQVDTNPEEAGEEYQDAMRLQNAKTVSRLAATGKLYLFGRKPKGAFFRIPGVEELTAQLERMLSRELESKGDSSMEEQYDLLVDKVKLVASGKSQFIKSLLIVGAPSSGKSFSVMRAIRDAGLNSGSDFIIKKGRITVSSLYRTLIEQSNGGLIIFDDCDSVVEDKNGINMLKGALDTDPVREISYDVKGTLNTGALSDTERDAYTNALSAALRYKMTMDDVEVIKRTLRRLGLLNKALKGVKSDDSLGGENGDDDFDTENSGDVDDDGSELSSEASAILAYARLHLPNKIDFKGRIIFISNMNEDEWDSAILTRAFYQALNFKDIEMLDFIDRIKDNIKTPNLSDELKQEVMDFIRERWQTGKLRRPVNFRLVQSAFDLALTGSWKKILSQM